MSGIPKFLVISALKKRKPMMKMGIPILRNTYLMHLLILYMG